MIDFITNFERKPIRENVLVTINILYQNQVENVQKLHNFTKRYWFGGKSISKFRLAIMINMIVIPLKIQPTLQ